MSRGTAWAGLVLIIVWVRPAPLRAAEPGDLQATVAAQGAVIQELRSELDQMRQEQKRGQDRVRSLEDKLEQGSGESSVSVADVDRRIEQFATFPESRFFASGYGTTEYVDRGGAPGTFGFSFNPIFHFMLTDRLHFDSELEIALEDNETNVELEIGQIDYLVSDWLTVSAGKFLLPFNQFGPRLHPSWINKLPDPPPFYRHGDQPGGFIPVMSDIGVMASGGTSLLGTESKLNYAVYAANGPATPILEEPSADPLAYRYENFPDENQSKSVGARVGFLPIPNLEVGASVLSGDTKDAGRPTLLGLDGWYQLGGLELRGEYARLERTGGGNNPSVYGYYAQAAYRLRDLRDRYPGIPEFVGRFEPVVRWGQVDGYRPLNRRQLSLGLDYWLYDSVPIKLAWESNSGEVSEDAFFLQLAYGF